VSSTYPPEPIAAAADLGTGRTALAEIAELARRTIPGAAEVSVMVLRDTGAHTAASTGQLARELDQWQYERGHGPCLDACRIHDVVAAPDLGLEARWPSWSVRAVQAGARSLLSIGLPGGDRATGALNVYATVTDAFDDDAITVAKVLADHAAVVRPDDRQLDAQTALARHLRAAVERRAVVERAKNIIMGDRRCTPNEASAILRRLSQHTHRRPSDIAAALVDRAAVPPCP
jgi:GAF domain-containing protein